MARAAADVHGADAVSLAQARAQTVSEPEFRELVATMVAAVRGDFHARE
jgi:hypothetical protein